MSLTPTVKHTGQESGGELCEIVDILMGYAVKICQQCLQTASASWDFVPQTLDPTGEFRSPDP